jgi:ketosteroid isomerase-like protein
VDSKERLVRDLYAARARGDSEAVRALLAPDVIWHEPGGEDYSGDYRGPNEVSALLEKLLDVTGGSFTLGPDGFLATADHVAARIRWSAERDGMRIEGSEIAVYRVADGSIAEAWFYPDGFDPDALTAVFSYGDRGDR